MNSSGICHEGICFRVQSMTCGMKTIIEGNVVDICLSQFTVPLQFKNNGSLLYLKRACFLIKKGKKEVYRKNKRKKLVSILNIFEDVLINGLR